MHARLTRSPPLHRRVDLHVREQVLYIRHPIPAEPAGQRLLWCRAGEWRFVGSLRHSAPAILRHAMETMVGIPDCGWKKPANEPGEGRARQAAGRA